MRKKLVSLIREVTPYWAEVLSDYLMVNGVIIPVRCKDCKWRQQDDVNRNFCGLGDFYCGDTDYCSRGERKDND